MKRIFTLFIIIIASTNFYLQAQSYIQLTKRSNQKTKKISEGRKIMFREKPSNYYPLFNYGKIERINKDTLFIKHYFLFGKGPKREIVLLSTIDKIGYKTVSKGIPF